MGCILARFKNLRKLRKPPLKSGYKSMKKSRTVTFNLKKDDKEILIKHWENTVLTQEPDLFLKTMMASIKDSPKLLDIISRKTFDPSIESIAEWPKLQQMAVGNCRFFTKQIVTNRLDEGLVRKDSEVLGAIHIQYCAYGFKPTFLDIWQSNMISIIEQCSFHPQIDKVNFIRAFSELSNFLCTLMVVEYEDSMQSVRRTDRNSRKAVATC
uniref:GLOBIN domain-containing protein n=1 Tax=Steinernema glaseri TaxID=37863 RepID=A0A1I8A431_9BILA